LFPGAILSILACTFLGAFHTAVAQSTTGSFVGRVTDATGALVPGAQIIAVNHDTNIHFSGHSNSTGDYVIQNVTPGVYTVTASRPGFANIAVPEASLVIDQKLLINFQLKAGAVTETATVTTAPSLLQTQTSETGTVIEAEDIVDLPLQGRNFYSLTLLGPGVASVGGSVNTLNLSVNGQREFANNVQVDGIGSTTNRTQDVTITPSVDAVQEFKVATSAYNAEFGNASAGVISIQTKSGTNSFHGVAFEFFRPNFTTARPYAFTGQVSPPSIYKQHNYGGTLGGPIKKDKAFFFISYEGIKGAQAFSELDATPPISLVKFNGDGSVDLSGLIDPADGKEIPIFDPNISYACNGNFSKCHPQQFAGNIIPANRVSQAGKNTLLNFYPKPNLPGTGNGWFKNFGVYSPVTNGGRNADGRYDQKLSNKDQLSLVYHYSDSNSLTTDPYHGATPVVGAGDADQANNQVSRSQSLSATETHILSPSTLNEFRFGFTRFSETQLSLLDGHDYSSQFGIGNVAVPGFPATDAYPYFDLEDGYLTGGSTYKPFLLLDSNFEVEDSLTLSQVGRHDIKVGASYRKLNSHPDFSLFPTGFQFYESFGFAQTSDPSFTYEDFNADNFAGGSDIADLLLGLPASTDIGLQLTKPHTQSFELRFYAQDTFRVTPKLTLNYGLRYEYQNPYTEVNNDESNYDVASGHILLAGRGGNSNSLIQASKFDFGPRVGFAYQLGDKTVVRGGWGYYYSPENDGREDFLTKNAPFADQAKYTNNVFAGGPYQYQLDAGVPRNTTIQLPANGVGFINPAAIPDGNLVTTYSVDPKIKTGNSQLFNLTVQRQLGSSISVEASYVASLSHDLSYQIGDINANPNNGGSPPDGNLNPNLGAIQFLGSYGFANYNSLQVKVTKRASRNLSFLASYTYGHSIDNGPAPFNLGHINGDSPQNPFNLSAEVASSDSDIRHNFVFSGLYRLPFGKGQTFFSNWSSVSEFLLGGWQINSIYNMRTGSPINVTRSADAIAAFPGLRPNIVGNPNLPKSKRVLNGTGTYFNTAAFSVVGLSGTQLPGDAGRNLFNGPGFVNVDFSLFKEFAVLEKYKLQTRLEAFNATNTPHFNNPDGNISDGPGNFGVITGASVGQSFRIIQIAGKFIF